jgi:hypothetical protein
VCAVGGPDASATGSGPGEVGVLPAECHHRPAETCTGQPGSEHLVAGEERLDQLVERVGRDLGVVTQ